LFCQTTSISTGKIFPLGEFLAHAVFPLEKRPVGTTTTVVRQTAVPILSCVKTAKDGQRRGKDGNNSELDKNRPARQTSRQEERMPRAVGAFEVKTQFSRIIEDVETGGADSIITKRGRPVAQITPLKQEKEMTHAEAIAGLIEIRTS
jgi:prevent-host-death family protein